jgi:hypothetical protein
LDLGAGFKAFSRLFITFGSIMYIAAANTIIIIKNVENSSEEFGFGSAGTRKVVVLDRLI